VRGAVGLTTSAIQFLGYRNGGFWQWPSIRALKAVSSTMDRLKPQAAADSVANFPFSESHCRQLSGQYLRRRWCVTVFYAPSDVSIPNLGRAKRRSGCAPQPILDKCRDVCTTLQGLPADPPLTS
jgi:hypothetical protein